MDYKVSIIVPVYRAEKYLNKCVESLLVQTLDSIEIILLDDGSPDRCCEILDNFESQYRNIKVFHLENGGPSRARNIGLRNASGKYVGFVDADDYVESNMFEILYEEAERQNADIMMCSYFIDNGKYLRKLDMNYKQEYNGRAEIINGLSALYVKQYHNGLYSVCNKLFRNDLLQINEICFDKNLIRAEDAWFVFACLKVANKVRFVDEALYVYRQVDTSTMHTIQKDRFERSKAFRIKLMEESNTLKIDIDWNEFYYEFLYESFVYCRAMMQQRNKKAVMAVLDDVFFFKACEYSKYLPQHLKIMCKLELKGYKWILVKILEFWGKSDKV